METKKGGKAEVVQTLRDASVSGDMSMTAFEKRCFFNKCFKIRYVSCEFDQIMERNVSLQAA